MSAVNVLVQPRQGVHILSDGLGYRPDGVIVRIGPKCFTIPNANCAIASMGAGSAALVFGYDLGSEYSTFDEIVENAEKAIPGIYQRHKKTFDQAQFSDVQLFIAGWSDERDQAEAYAMLVTDGSSDEHWRKMHASEDAFAFEPFKLQRIDDYACNPGVEIETMKAAHYPVRGTTLEEIVANTDPQVDLLHMMEMQRRMETPLRAGLDLHYWVGGFALLTSVTRDGITQKVLHRWSEDRVNDVVTPQPIDWAAWRAARTANTVDFNNMSRLKREMAARKAAKSRKQ